MRHLVTASFMVLACALGQPAVAQDEAAPVPVQKASYHLPVFSNDYMMLLDVYIPPGKSSNYHTHSLDQASVLIEEADQKGQVYGQPPGGERRGNVGFAFNSKTPITHRGSNIGTTPFHNIVMALLKPQASGFTPGSRAEVPQYTQVQDNERVRGWRLMLEPGQSAAAITQKAPGMRVVVDGGAIVETVPGELDRAKAMRTGMFYWQDPGVTRAIRNTGTTRVELVEIELK